jgi:hypothetical protein
MNNFNVQMQNIYTLKCEQIIMRIMDGVGTKEQIGKIYRNHHFKN